MNHDFHQKLRHPFKRRDLHEKVLALRKHSLERATGLASSLPLSCRLFVPAYFYFVVHLTTSSSFTLQQWSGQNSVGYYAPQIFQSIGYSSESASLLASGVYGVLKVVATAIFVFFLIERVGRKWSLFWSGMWMGIFFFIVGSILKTHPPPATPAADGSIPKASQAMAAMLYIYVVAYSWGWGPVPWIYCADIFPNRTRHYGLAFASATQWLWSELCRHLKKNSYTYPSPADFVVSKEFPPIKQVLGYKVFLMYAAINIGGMAVFSLFIPETKGRSLEEVREEVPLHFIPLIFFLQMDVIFGSVSSADRQADIDKGTFYKMTRYLIVLLRWNFSP